MIKPKHISLKGLPTSVYKELPKKSLHPSSLRYLALNYPEHLIYILEHDSVSVDDKYLILEHFSFSNPTVAVVDSLLKYSNHSLTALREASVYSLSFFPQEAVIYRLEELESVETNNIIKSCAKNYLNELTS